MYQNPAKAGMDVYYLGNQNEGESTAVMAKFAAWIDSELENVRNYIK